MKKSLVSKGFGTAGDLLELSETERPDPDSNRG